MRTTSVAILAAAMRRRRSRPRGRAVDRAAVGQRDLIWQLTAAGHVARYVLVKGGKLLQFITSPVVGVVNSDWFLQPVANRRDGAGEIGISAYQGKSIDAIDKHGIEKHFCGDVHVRSLLFKFDDRGHAICFVAGNAWLLEERHLDFVLCVKALDYFNFRKRGERLKIVVLAKKLVGIVGVRLYSCGEIFDRDDLNVAGDKCAGEFFKIKPFVRSAFQHAVEQVESVDIYIDFHGVSENAKAGLPRPCAASAVPWRVDVGIVPKSLSVRKGANFGEFCVSGFSICANVFADEIERSTT